MSVLRLNAGRVLHVGCGRDKALPEWFQAAEIVSVDIEPRNHPDYVADMRELPAMLRDGFDAVYACHVLEHVSRADAVLTLQQFRKCLHPGGIVVVIVPDLTGVSPDDEVLYESECGPVTGADMYWGHQRTMEQYPSMAHRFGYVPRTLRTVLRDAGLRDVQTVDLSRYNVVGIGVAP